MMNLQPNFRKTTAWLLKCMALPYNNWLETYNSSTYIAVLTQSAMVKQSNIYGCCIYYIVRSFCSQEELKIRHNIQKRYWVKSSCLIHENTHVKYTCRHSHKYRHIQPIFFYNIFLLQKFPAIHYIHIHTIYCTCTDSLSLHTYKA